MLFSLFSERSFAEQTFVAGIATFEDFHGKAPLSIDQKRTYVAHIGLSLTVTHFLWREKYLKMCQKCETYSVCKCGTFVVQKVCEKILLEITP
jgi:hypothetical protein